MAATSSYDAEIAGLDILIEMLEDITRMPESLASSAVLHTVAAATDNNDMISSAWFSPEFPGTTTTTHPSNTVAVEHPAGANSSWPLAGYTPTQKKATVKRARKRSTMSIRKPPLQPHGTRSTAPTSPRT
jgi:hypothetical protein